MPRIFTSASDPIDFCSKCFPDNRGDCFGYDHIHPLMKKLIINVTSVRKN